MEFSKILGLRCLLKRAPGSGCSKLTMWLVNISIKFQSLISEICQHFLLKKMREAFAMQKLLSHFQQKISVVLVIK